MLQSESSAHQSVQAQTQDDQDTESRAEEDQDEDSDANNTQVKSVTETSQVTFQEPPEGKGQEEWRQCG